MIFRGIKSRVFIQLWLLFFLALSIIDVLILFFVLEKSGRRHEIDQLYKELSVFGIMQFTRSGRIAVTKDEMKISKMLAAFNN
jgi:acetolactate synthase-1/3 small subunit